MKVIPLHYDIVWNEWHEGRQRVVAKVWEETMARVPPQSAGDYCWSTDWHAEEACPFK